MLLTKGIYTIAALVGGMEAWSNLRNRTKHNAFLNEAPGSIKTIAHRGVSNRAPENTMAAFKQALQMGCDYIELDVHMTLEGDLAVIHDTTVDRTTDGTGRVRDLIRNEIKQFDAGSWFGPSFAGEKIPLLEEVLDAFGGKIGLLIELKKPSLYPGLVERVVDLLKKRHFRFTSQSHPIMVQSFDIQALRQFYQLMPEVPIGVLISRKGKMKQRMLREFAQFADYVNPKKSLIDPQSVSLVHSLGMEMMAWTLQKQENLLPLLYAGVDGIITDDPVFARMGKSLQRNRA